MDSSKRIVTSIAVKKWIKFVCSTQRQRKQLDNSHRNTRLKRAGIIQLRKFMHITTHAVDGAPSQTVPKRDRRRLAVNFHRCFHSRKAFRHFLYRFESRKQFDSNENTSRLGHLYLCFHRFRVRLSHHTTRVVLAQGSTSIQRLGYLSQVKRALRGLLLNVRSTPDHIKDAVMVANENSKSSNAENLDSLIIDVTMEDGAAVISSLSGSEVDLTFSSNSELDNNPLLQFPTKTSDTVGTRERDILKDGEYRDLQSNMECNISIHRIIDELDTNTGQDRSLLVNIGAKDSQQANGRLASSRSSSHDLVAVSRFVRVLWDIENVQIPKRVSGLSVVESLQRTLSTHAPHPLCGCGVDLRITAFLRPNDSHSSAVTIKCHHMPIYILYIHTYIQYIHT